MAAFDEIYDQLGAFAKIVIEYRGSGDEGWIEDITGRSAEDVNDGVDVPLEIEYDLYKELERAAHDVLDDHYAGWEINEGSHGHITITVKERQVFLHHGTIREITDWEDAVI
jgi:hypothetical protein